VLCLSLQLSLVAAAAEPFVTCLFLGTPSARDGSTDPRVLFDGQTLYNTSSVIFTAEFAPKGCGVILEFSEPVELSKVVVHSSKPNESPWGPTKSEFSIWNEETHLWKEATVIPDVTGRISEEKFTCGDSATTWNAPADEAINALKITLYGGGIWLTEIEIYDHAGKKIPAQTAICTCSTPPTEVLAAASWIGGVPGHATTFGPDLPYIGNPNTLPRRDRVLFTIDLNNLLLDGSVKQALLSFKIQPMGRLAVNRLAIYQITPGHNPLAADDLVFGEQTLLRDFIFDINSNQEIILDVTENINNLLDEGDGLFTVRITDATCDKFGNRVSYAEGVIIEYPSVKLEVVK